MMFTMLCTLSSNSEEHTLSKLAEVLLLTLLSHTRQSQWGALGVNELTLTSTCRLHSKT